MSIRHNELRKEVIEDDQRLSDEAKYWKLKYNDITFEEWVLSSTKEGDIIEIDYENNTFEVVGHYA